MKTPEEKAGEWARIHYPPTRRPNNPYFNHHDWHIAKASFLAGHKEGAAERGEWRKWPEEKPDGMGPYLTWMDDEPDMGPRMDACHYMPAGIPGQTEGWGTPLFYAWANHKVIAWHPTPAPYTPEKGEGG